MHDPAWVCSISDKHHQSRWLLVVAYYHTTDQRVTCSNVLSTARDSSPNSDHLQSQQLACFLHKIALFICISSTLLVSTEEFRCSIFLLDGCRLNSSSKHKRALLSSALINIYGDWAPFRDPTWSQMVQSLHLHNYFCTSQYVHDPTQCEIQSI